MAPDVADFTKIPHPPKGHVPTQLAGLLEAQEIVVREAHEGPEDPGDDGTNESAGEQCDPDELAAGLAHRRASRGDRPSPLRQLDGRSLLGRNRLIAGIVACRLIGRADTLAVLCHLIAPAWVCMFPGFFELPGGAIVVGFFLSGHAAVLSMMAMPPDVPAC